MTDIHQHPKHASAEPDAKTSEVEDHADSDIYAPGSFIEAEIPLVAFVDDPREPHADVADDIGETHARALSEVAELVSQDAREFFHRQAGGQRQSDGQDYFIASHTDQSAIKTGGGIDLAINVHAARERSFYQLADSRDEREQKRIALRGQGILGG